MLRRLLKTGVAAIVLVAAIPLPAMADSVEFGARLKPNQEVPPTDSHGDGEVEFRLRGDSIRFDLEWDDLTSDLIMPKHIWEGRESGTEALIEVIDLEPVGSGPYKVLDSSPERVALERNDSYWGATTLGTPAPKYLVHPIFDSNDGANLAFSQGDIDFSQTFLPQIWQLWEDKGVPAGTWFKEEPYHVPGNIPIMHINISKPGLDNVLVRRALAHAIDYAQIAETAMSRYSAHVVGGASG